MKHIYDMTLEERQSYVKNKGTKTAIDKYINKLKTQQELRRVK